MSSTSVSDFKFPLLDFLQTHQTCPPPPAFSGQSPNILGRIETVKKRKFAEIKEKKPVHSSERALKKCKKTLAFISGKKSYLGRLEKMCGPEYAAHMQEYFSLACLKKIIIPALKEKNLFIRNPMPEELDRISDHLHFCPEDGLFELIENRGVRDSQKESTRMLVIQADKEESVIHGAIQFSFTKEGGSFCYIDSIQIDPDWKRRGHGFLLLACAIVEAREKGCAKIYLVNSIESSAFYEKYGFYPNSLKEKWPHLSREERIGILSEPTFEEMILLDLRSAEILEMLQRNLAEFFTESAPYRQG